jgi:hypothetical protein
MILYHTEVRSGHQVVEAGTAYGNSTEEVRDRALRRRPLKTGETLVVSDFNGFALSLTAGTAPRRLLRVS